MVRELRQTSACLPNAMPAPNTLQRRQGFRSPRWGGSRSCCQSMPAYPTNTFCGIWTRAGWSCEQIKATIERRCEAGNKVLPSGCRLSSRAAGSQLQRSKCSALASQVWCIGLVPAVKRPSSFPANGLTAARHWRGQCCPKSVVIVGSITTQRVSAGKVIVDMAVSRLAYSARLPSSLAERNGDPVAGDSAALAIKHHLNKLES